MDLVREEAHAFVFRPLTWAEASASSFKEVSKDTNGCLEWEKKADMGNLTVKIQHPLYLIENFFLSSMQI